MMYIYRLRLLYYIVKLKTINFLTDLLMMILKLMIILNICMTMKIMGLNKIYNLSYNMYGLTALEFYIMNYPLLL